MTQVPRVGIFTTHPIQYQVPWFRALHRTKAVGLTVYYHKLPNATEQGIEFGIPFTWDIPLLDGYPWALVGKHPASPSNQVNSLFSAVQRSDVLVVLGWQHAFLRRAALIGRLTGRPALVRGESNALRRRPLAIRLCHASFLRLFSGYLAIGEANDTFYQSYGIPKTKRAWCRYFVDNDRFRQEAARLEGQRTQLRQTWDIPEDAFCFLFAGKLVQKKRPLDLLAALRSAASKVPNLHVLIAGDGALRPLLARFAAAHRLPVTFTGFLNQNDIAKAYTASDALVLPSDYGETWGLVVNEVMLFRKPVIVSDRVGCGPDLVTDGRTGFRFPCGNVDALAEAMMRLARDRNEARRMGDNAFRQIVHAYSVDAAMDGTLAAVYRQMGLAAYRH